MRIRTLLRYLIGSREAILEIAVNPWAVPLGFVFVLSAGLAREYDGADLVHEPWHALLPIPASLATSFLLFCITDSIPLLSATRRIGFARPSFWTGYRMFLGLFWLTAPMAWLYAVPYERFLGPADATRANLCTLGLVALWRVLLMCRVVTVLMGYAAWQAFALVCLLGDAEALLVGLHSPVPIIELMGGVRYTESELVLKHAAANLVAGAGCSLPIWIVLAVVAAVRARPAWRALRLAEPSSERRPQAIFVLAGLSVLGWVFVLPFTQSEQMLRRKVEKLMIAGQIDAALAEMSAHEASAFPPQWDPPPRTVASPGQGSLSLLDVLGIIVERPPAAWVREVYVSKFTRYVQFPYMSEEEAQRSARLLKVLPEGATIKRELQTNSDYAFSALKAFIEKNEKPLKNGKEAERHDTQP